MKGNTKNIGKNVSRNVGASSARRSASGSSRPATGNRQRNLGPRTSRPSGPPGLAKRATGHRIRNPGSPRTQNTRHRTHLGRSSSGVSRRRFLRTAGVGAAAVGAMAAGLGGVARATGGTINVDPATGYAGTRAEGSITMVDAGLITEGKTVEITSVRTGGVYVYEFDSDGSVQPGNIPVPLTGSETAAGVADAFRKAAFIFAASGTGSTVTLYQDYTVPVTPTAAKIIQTGSPTLAWSDFVGGSKGDTNSIQDALDAALPGDIVQFPVGHYTVCCSIRTYGFDGIIKGADPNNWSATTIEASRGENDEHFVDSAQPNNDSLFWFENSANVTILDITLQCLEDDPCNYRKWVGVGMTTALGNLIRNTDCANALIKNVSFKGKHTTTAEHPLYGSVNLGENYWIYQTPGGGQPTNTVIENCEMENAAWNIGIDFLTDSSVTIGGAPDKKSTFKNAANTQIQTRDCYNTSFTVTHCDFFAEIEGHNEWGCVFIQDPRDGGESLIANNYFTGIARRSCITVLAGSTTNPTMATITKNTIENWTSTLTTAVQCAAIFFGGSSFNTLTRNTLVNINAKYGIRLQSRTAGTSRWSHSNYIANNNYNASGFTGWINGNAPCISIGPQSTNNEIGDHNYPPGTTMCEQIQDFNGPGLNIMPAGYQGVCNLVPDAMKDCTDNGGTWMGTYCEWP